MKQLLPFCIAILLAACNTINQPAEENYTLAYSSADIKESRYDITLMDWKTKEKKKLTDSTYKSQMGPVFVKK